MTVINATTTTGRWTTRDTCPDCGTYWRDHCLGDCQRSDDIGACQGCGSYGPAGSLCIRRAQECGVRI